MLLRRKTPRTLIFLDGAVTIGIGVAWLTVIPELLWEQMQSEDGPLPTELGASEDGRVVVMYPLQSNPYEAGTADADAVDQFVSESSIVTESFQFLQ